jgi:hypothetical protein
MQAGPTETGVIKGIGNLANGFTSPTGLGTFWLGGLPAWAQRAISIGFAAQMAKDTPDVAAQLGTEIGKNPEDRDNEKIANLIMQGVGTVAMTSGAGLHGVPGEVPAFAGVPEVAPATTTGMRRNVTSAPNLSEIPADQPTKTPNSEIAAATQNITSAENANNVLQPEQAGKPISQKIDDLAAAVKVLRPQYKAIN